MCVHHATPAQGLAIARRLVRFHFPTPLLAVRRCVLVPGTTATEECNYAVLAHATIGREMVEILHNYGTGYKIVSKGGKGFYISL